MLETFRRSGGNPFVLVLLSAHIERFSVSRMQDFFTPSLITKVFVEQSLALVGLLSIMRLNVCASVAFIFFQ